MSIIREEVTVLGTQCIQHTLTDRPQFTRLVDHPDGLFAEVKDGDMVLRAGDEATFVRWAEECMEAARALAARRAKPRAVAS